MAKKKDEETTSLAMSDRQMIVDAYDHASTIGLVDDINQTWLDDAEFERLITLEPGKGIRGIFLGPGPMAEVTDPITGDLRPIGTWRFELRPGIVARLLGSARLDSEFSTPKGLDKHPNLGRRVRVGKLGSVVTKRGRNVTEYLIAWERAIAS